MSVDFYGAATAKGHSRWRKKLPTHAVDMGGGVTIDENPRKMAVITRGGVRSR